MKNHLTQNDRNGRKLDETEKFKIHKNRKSDKIEKGQLWTKLKNLKKWTIMDKIDTYLQISVHLFSFLSTFFNFQFDSIFGPFIILSFRFSRIKKFKTVVFTLAVVFS